MRKAIEPSAEALQKRERIVALDKQHLWHPYTPMAQYIAEATPLVIDRAEGARIFDLDGRSIIDGNASWWTSLLGHNHPRLVEALKVQASKLCHTSLAGVTHQPAAEFAEALATRAPAGLDHVFLSDNGSTAVEAAIKQAAQYWHQNGAPKKTRFLSLADAFHGETLGVTALGGVEAFRSPFGALTMPTGHLTSPADDETRALEELELELKEHGDEIAALVVEPLIQGAGGMKIYAPRFLKKARELTEAYDVFLIVDEVFTGYGRTGTFWACEQADVVPDIICSAKGLSGGLLPFAATISSSRIFDGFKGEASRAFYYGHTYCGNPLGAAIGLEVLRIYEDEAVIAGVAERAGLIREAFAGLAELPGVETTRSLGMCGALELKGGQGYLERGGWAVFEKALERGVYLRPLGNVVYTVPALTIPLADLGELLHVMSDCVRSVAG